MHETIPAYGSEPGFLCGLAAWLKANLGDSRPAIPPSWIASKRLCRKGQSGHSQIRNIRSAQAYFA